MVSLLTESQILVMKAVKELASKECTTASEQSTTVKKIQAYMTTASHPMDVQDVSETLRMLRDLKLVVLYRETNTWSLSNPAKKVKSFEARPRRDSWPKSQKKKLKRKRVEKNTQEEKKSRRDDGSSGGSNQEDLLAMQSVNIATAEPNSEIETANETRNESRNDTRNETRNETRNGTRIQPQRLWEIYPNTAGTQPHSETFIGNTDLPDLVSEVQREHSPGAQGSRQRDSCRVS